MKSVLRKFRKWILFCMVWGCFPLLLSGCGQSKAARFDSVDIAMGTVVVQQIYARQPLMQRPAGDGGGDIADRALARIRQLEQETLSRRIPGSELALLNAGAGGAPAPLSAKMEAILSDCMEVSEASGGAFDITIGKVVALWDIDAWAGSQMPADAQQLVNAQQPAYQLPDADALAEALASAGYGKLAVENRSVSIPEAMSLDLGAVGKGIALDELLGMLEEEQAAGAVISVGGSVLTYGEKPDKSPWRVGILNPADRAGNLGVLSLVGQWCVSTSGDYERYVEVDGIRYHHIIDPGTGYPAKSGLRSVTILAKDGFLSDALSTACFVLGREKGMELAGRFAVEALFVDEDGTIVMTEGMRAYFSPPDET